MSRGFSAGSPAPESAPAARKCPYDECDGGGLIVDEATNTSSPCRCREQLIAQAVTRRAKTAIPKAFRGVSFDRPPLNEVDPMIRRHVEEFIRRSDERLAQGRGLWFFGDSHETIVSLAKLIARKASEGGASVATHSLPRLLMLLRSSYDTGATNSHLDLFSSLCAVDLLVLTDVGAHNQTDWAVEQLYSILNERWQDERSVIVTMTGPDPDRDSPERDLREAIQALTQAKRAGLDRLELNRIVERLEAVLTRLERIDSRPWADPLEHVRRQLGSRIVARLTALCDDPVPVAGPTLAPASRS